MRAFLKGAREGLLIMCHPGRPDEELARIDSVLEPRAEELAFGLLLRDLLRQPWKVICTAELEGMDHPLFRALELRLDALVVTVPAALARARHPHTVLIPHGVDTAAFAAVRPNVHSRHALFLGNYEYAPNIDAVEYRERDLTVSVLEFGIGTGRIALPLAQRGVLVHGIDLSRAMVSPARSPWPTTGWGSTSTTWPGRGWSRITSP